MTILSESREKNRRGVFVRSASTRAKMSEARKRAWADPSVRAKMSEASKRALADPSVRVKMSEARKRALADPSVRVKMDWLAPEQVQQLLSQLRNGARAVDVANDWLISPSHVYNIARKHGVALKGRIRHARA